MANILERVIAKIAPGVAARRAADRRKFEIIEGARAYDGASAGRRLRSWTTQISSANREISEGAAALRQRARDLVRNNPYADKIITNHADNIVGAGIVPRARTGNPDLDKTINDAFDVWQRKAGIEGQTFYSQQYLAVREMAEGGESIIRRHYVRPPSNLTPEERKTYVGLRLQVIESEQIDSSKNGAIGTRFSANGVEYNTDGTRRGIWLFGQHPGDGARNPRLKRESAVVKIEELAHMYRQDRNQSRGVPWLAPNMVTLKELDEYIQFELVRKKVESCTVGIVEQADDEDLGGLGLTDGGEEDEEGVLTTDAAGNPTEMMEPGMFHYLPKGRKVTFNNPSISAGMEAFVRIQLRRLASGASIPYAYLASDTSQGNHSSDRGIVIQHRRNIDHHQWHVVIPNLEIVMGWFVEDLIVTGALSPDVAVSWEYSPPRYESINPVDDARADVIEVRAGFKSEKDAIASRGYTIEQVYAEKKEAQTLADDLGLVLDTDPRKVSLNGQYQQSSSTGDDTKDGGTKPDAVPAKPVPGKSTPAKPKK